MSIPALDPRLAADCHLLGRMASGRLLLMNNALFPWFILVPDTDCTEFYRLDLDFQINITRNINAICENIATHYRFDKINIASIGNIVHQMHIHVVARRSDDLCWPGVVWGTAHKRPYAAEEVQRIQSLFSGITLS